MLVPLTLIAILAAAFALTHLEVRALGERVRLFQGLEYLLIGFLFGPLAVGALDTHAIRALGPVVAILTGFIGFRTGLAVDVQHVRSDIPGARRFGLVVAVLTAATVGAAVWFAMGVIPVLGDVPVAGRAFAAVVLGLGGAIVSRGAIDGGLVATRSKGPLSRALPRAASTMRLLVILAYGALVAIEHDGAHGLAPPAGLMGPVSGSLWIGMSVGVGGAVGAIFHVFVGHETDTAKLFVATIGAVMLASGMAFALHFSALFVSVIAGLVIATLSPSAPRLAEAAAKLERPFSATLMVLAGAAWVPIPATWWLFPLAYLAVRASALYAASWVATRHHPSIDPHTPGLGGGLLSQGALAVAVAAEYQLIPTHSLGAVVETTLLLGAAANELWARWALRRVLQLAGETRRLEAQEARR